jgi:hypothetical protein
MNMELSTIDHEANIHISHNKPQQGFEFFGLLISIIYLLYSIKQELSQKKRKEKNNNKFFFIVFRVKRGIHTLGTSTILTLGQI